MDKDMLPEYNDSYIEDMKEGFIPEDSPIENSDNYD